MGHRHVTSLHRRRSLPIRCVVAVQLELRGKARNVTRPA